jgi:hypothetical protein
MRIQLSDIEDRLLAMCEGDSVSVKLAQEVLGSWYQRKVSRSEIVGMVNRLGKLHLLKWCYQIGQRKHLSKALPLKQTAIAFVTFKATTLGESYLEKPREVV